MKFVFANSFTNGISWNVMLRVVILVLQISCQISKLCLWINMTIDNCVALIWINAVTVDTGEADSTHIIDATFTLILSLATWVASAKTRG